MSPDQAHLARKNLDRRLAPLRAEPLIAPPSGWIKAIREALGMTAEQLARRERAGLWADRDPAYPGDYRRKGGDHVRG